ncbi:lysyl-tRNA synthetase, class II [Babesia microti strain RI]|uniref:Lysyl-tRNA synthetase n=1 Tax=Babesia microti (strain RI) TaxID=1133968 RepID=A0A1R4AAR3_BABMR|nr:lysyl-tRNA synthetase, class II [Babesia microti strain RI]SJK86054.1 lysyl-tRNA synthetase, class II [Babesia microti strain RI]|eukprot:XP_021338251.1 lysyl-tRNA synthetase, class II [Babesia microti strain RI]
MDFCTIKYRITIYLLIAALLTPDTINFKLHSLNPVNLQTTNGTNLGKQLCNRIKKIGEIENYGDPYPVANLSNYISTAKEFRDTFQLDGECSYYGRVLSIRHGGLFVDLADDHQQKVQVKILLGNDIKFYETKVVASKIIELIDLGDILAVTGKCIKTPTGEASIEAKHITILSKCTTIPPDKKGLMNVEKKLRFRHLDLRYNLEAREVLLNTWRIKQIIRDILTQDYKLLEVETPILQSIPSGANASPFETHHNALDMKCYLRIAPELYLKRLISSGICENGLFEFAKCFRNEGITYRHSPEFSLLEIYVKGVDLPYMIRLFEDIVNKLYQRLHNAHPLYWDTIEYNETDVIQLNKPTHILHLPTSETPLAKKYNDNSTFSFESYLNGIEVCHGAVEECNPVQLRNNLGDSIDLDFLNAAENGLVPMSGLGIGLDRLAMVLCNQQNIKSTQAFNLLSQKKLDCDD